MSSQNDWGTDGQVSLPEPIKTDGSVVAFGGFAFTVNGLCHDLTEVDREQIYSAPYAPESK